MLNNQKKLHLMQPNKSSLKERKLPQRSNHLYQKDNPDIIHKQKEKDLQMLQNRLYQVSEQGDKIALQDYCLQKLRPMAVMADQFQTRRKVMAKYQNIFKKWKFRKKTTPAQELNHARTLTHHQALAEWESMKRIKWLQN